jgi:translation elongation factor EF-G
MFGYISQLRSFSQGRAQYTMQYDHYEPVDLPPDDPDRFPPAAAMRA